MSKVKILKDEQEGTPIKKYVYKLYTQGNSYRKSNKFLNQGRGQKYSKVSKGEKETNISFLIGSFRIKEEVLR